MSTGDNTDLAEAVREFSASFDQLTKDLGTLSTRENRLDILENFLEKFKNFRERYPWLYPTSEEVQRAGLTNAPLILMAKFANMSPSEREELKRALDELVATLK